jgi:DnaJ family protein C protein 2
VNLITDVYNGFISWSTNPNVPNLGGADLEWKHVKMFYDFWYSFKSWRDFSFDDEFDLEEADSREEKRWMERQNERERKKKKREEAARILRLVGLYYTLVFVN